MLDGSSLIILAGGKSERFGSPKGLYPFRGKPWILEQLKRARLCNFQEIITVVGYHEGKLRKALDRDRASGDQLVTNLTPDLGPFSSLNAGLLSRKIVSVPIFVLPVDIPLMDPINLQVLWNSLSNETRVVVPVHNDKKGHPVLLTPMFCESLLRVELSSPDARLDKQIQRLAPGERAFIEVRDPFIARNLNTRDEFHLYLADYERTVSISL